MLFRSDNYQNLSEDEKTKVPSKYTHTDFYGEYAIAFSKGWGEKITYSKSWNM